MTIQRKKPLARSTKPIKRSKPKPGKGLKGAPRTRAQEEFHDMLAQDVGCIACRCMGELNFLVSIHHIDGRTKSDAHWQVLPLCAGHHQDGTGIAGLTAVHPWKRRFEAEFGTQEALLGQCVVILEDRGHQIPAPVYEVLNRPPP